MVFVKGWKPSPEIRLKMSLAKKGFIPWNKGLKGHPSCKGFKGKHTKETKAKISQNRKGKCLANQHRKNKAPWNKGKPYFVHTKEWRQKVSLANSGSNHWNWKGGIDSINRLMRNSSSHKGWSKSVKQRDKWICQNCFKKQSSKSPLVAHHIVGWNKDHSLRFDISNGITLCRACHVSLHKPRLKIMNLPSPN